MIRRPVAILCACSWTGEVCSKSPCPSCGASYNDRISKERLAALVAVDARADAHLVPIMRMRLVGMRLLEADGPPRKGSETPGHRPPCRRHRVTERGKLVIDAAHRAAEVELRRHIAAESVSRHAGLGEAGR